MLQAMFSGVSGLSAFQTEMDVISNNIANISTTGYKTSRVNFDDVFSQTIKGAAAGSNGMGGTNPVQIGVGVTIGSIEVNQTQGSLQPTGKSTDCAIEGQGYFMIGDGKERFYSRDGSFSLDPSGNLVSAATGMNVLGWTADSSGVIDSTSSVTAGSAIKLPLGQMTISKQTSSVTYGGNINADTPVGNSYTVSSEIIDSLGKAHPLAVTFTRTSGQDWSWTAASADADPATPVGSGTVSFDTAGKCVSAPLALNLTLANPNGASPNITLQGVMSGATMSYGPSTLSTVAQDGFQTGALNGFSIGKNGVITGTFTNGMTQDLGRVALATFANPAGLSKSGGNLLTESANSGTAQVGQPSVAGMGTISSGFLEASNVDLSTEFATMILGQRAFQANSKIITTADQMLQELVQLKQ